MALLVHGDAPPESSTIDASPSGMSEVARPSGPWWLPRVWTVLLWALVASSVILSAMAFVRPTTSARMGGSPAVSPTRWDIAGAAELFVAAFVAAGEGTEDSLQPFMGEMPPSLQGVMPGDWFAARTTATSVARLGDGRWAVTVAADLLRRRSDDPSLAMSAVGVRYFRVELVEDNGAVAAAALPAIVAGPSPVGAARDDEWPAAPPLSDDPLADTVARFLAAMLTGDGELARYAAPGSGVRAAPATFETVSVERLAVRGSGEQRRVRAWLLGVSGTASMQLLYDLHLTRRDGRWEVTAVGAPTTAGAAKPDGPAAPSSTSEGS
jgi:hypothetical protein